MVTSAPILKAPSERLLNVGFDSEIADPAVVTAAVE